MRPVKQVSYGIVGFLGVHTAHNADYTLDAESLGQRP